MDRKVKITIDELKFDKTDVTARFIFEYRGALCDFTVRVNVFAESNTTFAELVDSAIKNFRAEAQNLPYVEDASYQIQS